MLWVCSAADRSTYIPPLKRSQERYSHHRSNITIFNFSREESRRYLIPIKTNLLVHVCAWSLLYRIIVYLTFINQKSSMNAEYPLPNISVWYNLIHGYGHDPY